MVVTLVQLAVIKGAMDYMYILGDSDKSLYCIVGGWGDCNKRMS